MTVRPASLAAVIVAIGCATLPRQLSLLARALAPSGQALRDAHHASMEAGLVRLVVLDRLVPPPTALIAALMIVIVVEPALALADGDRARIRRAIALGLVPLAVQRMGELALTYLAPVASPLSPGFVVTLPQQFATGPAILWAAGDAPPWIEALSARINLVTLWSVGIWTTGLRELDGQPLALWHVGLPAACLVTAGLVTWWLGPLVLSLVLGRP
jgi:hypothetical protein